MAPYLSPLRFRNAGMGIDVSEMSPLSLRGKLTQASAAVDTFCNATLLPERFDFRGGTVTNEQHIWQPPTPLLNEPGARRIFLNHRPIRTLTAFSIQYTNSYSITLQPSDLMVNTPAGFVEIVASQPTIIGYPPLGFWFGLYEPFVLASYTYGWQFAAVGDVLEAVSPSIYMASHGSWLVGGDVTVVVDDVEIDPGDYRVNTDDGTVTFNTGSEPTPDQLATVSYTHLLPSAIETATAIIATDLMGQARIAARGMIGLQSIRVAEVAITALQPSQMVSKNGVSIPASAANLLGGFVMGSVA